MGDDGGMRVVVVNELGGPHVLTVADREPATAGPGQLLVDVAAAGVNYMDIYQREGRPPYGRDLPFVPGSEGAGTVAALGPGAEGFAVGDRVAWAGAPGCYAEQAVVPAASAIRIPDGIDTRVAAAVMLQGITAHYLCHSTYPVASGDTVVVHAAAGGVGLLLTQMVKMLGGIVIATTSSPAKADLARQAGADHVTGYEEFGSVVREVTGGAGAAAVYDGVGQATFDASLAAVRPRGMMVCGGSAGRCPRSSSSASPGGSLFITALR
jgi:NADPH2:quinone reductase